jgi:hypothetical protein
MMRALSGLFEIDWCPEPCDGAGRLRKGFIESFAIEKPAVVLSRTFSPYWTKVQYTNLLPSARDYFNIAMKVEAMRLKSAARAKGP